MRRFGNALVSCEVRAVTSIPVVKRPMARRLHSPANSMGDGAGRPRSLANILNGVARRGLHFQSINLPAYSLHGHIKPLLACIQTIGPLNQEVERGAA